MILKILFPNTIFKKSSPSAQEQIILSSLHTASNIPHYFKEDYKRSSLKSKSIVYRDRNDQRKLMRLNELHKFSDGTLTRVMEKLDQMVKDFHLYEYNKGMETRKWQREGQEKKPGVLDIVATESNGTAIVTIQGNLVEGKTVVETVTRCHTTPEEPALNHIEPSSDDKHVSDGLEQQNPLVD
ncbi:hypothetical protein Tco_0281302 [Tanacetum coccineum]